MSNYTKATNFATKDALSSGNPLKIVKGTEIDTEFNNIATAVATKADLASPTFTGTVTIPTVSISAGTITGITDITVADGGTGASTAANARTNLGLVIGTNVQAWDADLDTYASKTPPSGAVVGTTDTQTLTNKTLTSPTLTTPNIDSAQFATVSGTAPIYPCRAWVNFNGTGTIAIRASGNVSSITDNGAGDYTFNFSTAMSDANYSVNMTASINATGIAPSVANLITTTTPTASLVRMLVDRNGVGPSDSTYVNVAVFR